MRGKKPFIPSLASIANHRKRYLFFTLVLIFSMTFGTMMVSWAKEDEDNSDSGKQNVAEIYSVDDLPGHKIGVQLGTTGDTYASDYEGDDAGTEIIRYNKGADAVQALKQNKIDCVLIDEQPAKAFVAKNPELYILDEEFTIEDYAICVQKGNTELLNQINDSIEALQQDGTIDQVINHYINGTGDTYKSPDDINYTGKITMVTNAGFPPYEYYENGVPTGIDIDIATAIADRMGLELEVLDVEFDSVIVSVQTGKADFGMAGMTVTEERKKNIDFTESYTTSKQVIIVNSGNDAQGNTLMSRIKQSFVEDGRWKYIPQGLLNTLIITIFAGIIGIVLGFLIAMTRVAYDRSDERSPLLKVVNAIIKLYITIFRGTPMMVQLLITYYVIFASVNIKPVIVAVIAFGLNSGAYVAEAIRAGMMSIPIGQFEAGRSLGFTYGQTMRYIIMGQAIKNALPAMCNEFIALLKESSIVGYIGLVDLTKAGDIIRSTTWEAMVPLVSIALIYLIIVTILTYLVGRLERRLKRGAK